MIRVQAEEIVVAKVLAAVGSDGDGAVALFLGTVRDRNRDRRVLHLSYEAYSELATREMERIVQRALERFSITSVAAVHRTGRLEIGQTSVAVAVAAPHRDAAFEACRFVIDSIKQTVPIWKKEAFEGGEAWIEGAGETPSGDQA